MEKLRIVTRKGNEKYQTLKCNIEKDTLLEEWREEHENERSEIRINERKRVIKRNEHQLAEQRKDTTRGIKKTR